VSEPQSSRIVRQESRHSKWSGWHAEDRHLDQDNRRRVCLSRILADLSRRVWQDK
jgi:hypothetical protein